MPISTIAGAPPVILSRSYIDSAADNADQLIASSMQLLAHRLYQMDPTAYWQGSLGASDAVTEYVTIGLYLGVSQASRVLDTIMLLNNNLNNFVLEYCADYTPGDGVNPGTGTWQTIVTVTGNAGADYINFLASPITANGLRLTMTTTQNAGGTGANQQKKLGNFIAALSKFQFGAASTPIRGMSSFRPRMRQKRVDVELADGTVDSTFFYWSDNSFTLWDFEVGSDQIVATDKANLDAVLQSPAPVLFYPEPGDNKRNVYLCQLKLGSYSPDYATQFKGAGYKLPFTFSQVGYF